MNQKLQQLLNSALEHTKTTFVRKRHPAIFKPVSPKNWIVWMRIRTMMSVEAL